MQNRARASKKQRELLQFIDGFIKGYGYGPSYREVMRALGYKSVSTVAVHVDGLITAGYLRKTTNSARSLEVVTTASAQKPDTASAHEKWLKTQITKKLAGDIGADDKRVLERTLELLLPPKKSGE